MCSRRTSTGWEARWTLPGSTPRTFPWSKFEAASRLRFPRVRGTIFPGRSSRRTCLPTIGGPEMLCLSEHWRCYMRPWPDISRFPTGPLAMHGVVSVGQFLLDLTTRGSGGCAPLPFLSSGSGANASTLWPPFRSIRTTSCVASWLWRTVVNYPRWMDMIFAFALALGCRIGRDEMQGYQTAADSKRCAIVPPCI
ncbi:hypothetical protein PYCCODRAFT_360969 [Trametes coccinea BRFM310]|uniref:Uncharacterized protein n=1 Tax=Trametes coccinea (strain BRFM310) TaxID=1353009 RepID=A0A1Y2J5Z6_TRAC3|nr:hypothetical protein PYCCODRAFT_360969 [Trametes coccinea BRFM310]